jgi:D-alanyl-D-alanine dipeptidase
MLCVEAANLPPCGGDVRSVGKLRTRGGQHRAPSSHAIRALLPLAATALALSSLAPLPAHASDLPGGFVRLRDADPTIRQDIRYAGSRNFLGRPANGYEAAECILTEPAAKALTEVQKALTAERLTLVVFDCYRPIRAVDDFVAWTRDGGPADPRWHPKVKRGDLIAEGYIGARSSHSRGSTVDLALAPLDGAAAADPDCGADKMGALEFGTGFDCFDERSRTAFSPLAPAAMANRKKLVAAMQAAGFRNYSREWWHFTLKNEPHKEQAFDFRVESSK